MKIMVLTLYAGESQIDRCVAALEAQSLKPAQHEIFRNLPNLEAHRRLYRHIMDHRQAFDAFVKVDADMVLTDDTTLESMSKLIEADPNLDHAVFSLRDWYAGELVMGMHMFSNRVCWRDLDDGLFVDPDPVCPGTKALLWEHPVGDHAPEPSPREAWLFGVHRALKVVQRGRRRKNLNQARYHIELLETIYREFRRTGDVRRGLVILGAQSVFDGAEATLEDKSIMPEAPAGLDAAAIRQRLGNWNHLRRRWWRRLRWVTAGKVSNRL